MYGWEAPFIQRSLDARDDLHKTLDKLQVNNGVNFGLAFNGTNFASCLVFIMFSVTGGTLTPENVFPALFVLNIFRFYGSVKLGTMI